MCGVSVSVHLLRDSLLPLVTSPPVIRGSPTLVSSSSLTVVLLRPNQLTCPSMPAVLPNWCRTTSRSLLLHY